MTRRRARRGSGPLFDPPEDAEAQLALLVAMLRTGPKTVRELYDAGMGRPQSRVHDARRRYGSDFIKTTRETREKANGARCSIAVYSLGNPNV